MLPLVLIVVLGAIAGIAAWVLNRRTRPEPERAASWTVPSLVAREDFVRPDAPWLVAVFSSATCLACQSTWEKAQLLESDVVAVEELEAIERKDLHDRYGIDAVPLVLVVDAVGSVRRSFVGPPTATDLWAALAELREPGSVPEGCLDHGADGQDGGAVT